MPVHSAVECAAVETRRVDPILESADGTDLLSLAASENDRESCSFGVVLRVTKMVQDVAVVSNVIFELRVEAQPAPSGGRRPRIL